METVTKGQNRYNTWKVCKCNRPGQHTGKCGEETATKVLGDHGKNTALWDAEGPTDLQRHKEGQSGTK